MTLLHLPPLWQLWHRHFLWHTLWQTGHAPLCLKLTTCSSRAQPPQVAQVEQKVFKVRCALHIQVHEALSRETWKFKKVAKLLKVEGCQHCNHCDQQHGKEPIKGKSLGLGFARKQRRSLNKRATNDSCVCVQIWPVSFFLLATKLTCQASATTDHSIWMQCWRWHWSTDQWTVNSDIDQPKTASQLREQIVLQRMFSRVGSRNCLFWRTRMSVWSLYCEVNFERGRKNKSLKLNDNLQKKMTNDTFSDYRWKWHAWQKRK